MQTSIWASNAKEYNRAARAQRRIMGQLLLVRRTGGRVTLPPAGNSIQAEEPDVREQLEQRLVQLEQEYEEGQKMLADLEARRGRIPGHPPPHQRGDAGACRIAVGRGAGSDR